MRENRLRTLWRNDQAAVNGWLAIPSAFSAEVMAHHTYRHHYRCRGYYDSYGYYHCFN